MAILRSWGLMVFAALTVSSAFAQGVDVEGLAGVYKRTVQAQMMTSGEKYEIEEVLEVVPYGAGAYIRLRYHFDNGHVCAFWGIAMPEGDALIYRRYLDYRGKTCMLGLKRQGQEVVTWDDQDSCRVEYCGARGYLANSFDAKARRPIRYMPRLLASREYAEAVAEYEAKQQDR